MMKKEEDVGREREGEHYTDIIDRVCYLNLQNC
jgi:hypothetical protein